MTTIREDLEIAREDLKKVYSRLGKYRKIHGMAEHAKAMKVIRDRIMEDIEVLQEFTEKHF